MTQDRTFRKTAAAIFRNKSYKRFVLSRPFTVIALIAALAGFCSSSLVNAATPSAGTITGIAGKCLDNQAGRKVAYNKIDLYACNGAGAQQWTVNGTATAAGSIVVMAIVWTYTIPARPLVHW